MKNAERAYQTAGISANRYMEQVTSFSASLINSLEGDTAKAAQVADMAIQDMSDNANTFGTSMESIENAYAGFARGNFTMLDNLKLGFAGSKEGMQQLLDKAEEITGKKYDISNLKDIYEAIHEVQGELNITGTTAKEAAQTVEGSVNMMKASWENLLIAIGKGEGVNEAVNQFLASLGTVAKNIIPRVITIVGSIVAALVQAIPDLMMSLAEAISNFADTIGTKSSGEYAKAGLNILKSLVKGILKATPELIAALGKLAIEIVKKVGSIDLKAVGRAIINSLLQGLKAAWDALKNWVNDKVDWIKSKFAGAKSAGNAGGGGGSGHRIGLREVPYDGYLATLHKGETVLSAAEVNQYKKYLESLDNTASGIVNGISAAGAMNNTGVTEAHITINLGGSKIAEQVFRLNKQGQLAFEG